MRWLRRIGSWGRSRVQGEPFFVLVIVHDIYRRFALLNTKILTK